MQDLFADGVSDVSVAGGVVRVTFCVNSKKGKQAPVETRASFTVMMPVEGFANMIPGFQQVIDQLVKDGVLKTRQPGQLQKPGSPNFS